MEISLRNAASGFILACTLCLAICAYADEPVRLDATSSASARESFGKMMDQSDARQRKALAIAILRINMEGVGSVQKAMADPSLQAFGVERIKDKVAGMTAAEIIALGERSSTVRIEEGR